MKLIIGLALTVIVMTSASATDKRNQTMIQWIPEFNSTIYNKEFHNLCVEEVHLKFKGDHEKFLGYSEAKAAFNETYALCETRLGKFRGHLAEFYREFASKHNFSQIYCFKMELNHTGYIMERNNDSFAVKYSKQIQINYKEPTAYQFDSIQIGSKCNETDKKYLEEGEFFAYSINRKYVGYKCDIPDVPYKQCLYLEYISVQNTKSFFFTYHLMNFVEDYKYKLFPQKFNCKYKTQDYINPSSIYVDERNSKGVNKTPSKNNSNRVTVQFILFAILLLISTF